MGERLGAPSVPAGARPAHLMPDCAACFGLCCVLLPFRRASGFGADKPGGEPCQHLSGDDRCDIHAVRAQSGWPSCVSFDCRGAGQLVSQVSYAGRSWRDGSDRDEMAAVFSTVYELHSMLVALAANPAGDPLAARIARLTAAGPQPLLHAPLADLWAEVDALAPTPPAGPPPRSR